MSSSAETPEQRALAEAARLISISYRGVEGGQVEHDQLLTYAKQTTHTDPLGLAIASAQLATLAIIGLAHAKSVDFEAALRHVLDAAQG